MVARIIVRYLDGSVREELRYVDPEVVRALRDAVYCPGGFRIEFGLGGQHVVCYDAFRIRRQGEEIVLEEIGYYKERIG